MRAPRSRGRGGARHRSQLTSAAHGNPVAVRWARPATDRPTVREAEVRGGNRTAKKRMAAHRKVTGKRRQRTGPSINGRLCITGRIPDYRVWARKGADVSRVAL